MTNIRDVIREYLDYHFYADKWHQPHWDVELATDEFLRLLHSQGVVILDEGAPEYCLISMDKITAAGKTAYIDTGELSMAGFEKIKPLI